MNSRRNAVRSERQQQKIDAGTIAERFPRVEGIVVSMENGQPGIGQSMSRTLRFTPSSHALFKVECLSKGCADGGFDLSGKITSMIRNRKETASGEMSCKGAGPAADHSRIVYEITITYTK